MNNSKRYYPVRLRRGFVVGALACAMAACGGVEGAPPDKVQARLESNLPAILDSTANAQVFLEQNAQWADFGASLESVERLMPFYTEDPIEPVAAINEGEMDGEGVAAVLIEKIFNDGNYEGGGVYRIRGEVLCEPEEVPGEPQPVVDQGCVDGVNALQLRIRVVEAGDGLDATLLVGEDRNEPLSLELRSDSVSLVADLSEVKDVLASFADLSNEPAQLPEVMEGVVAASLLVSGPEDVTLQVAVRKAVAIELLDAESGPISFSTDVAEPLLSLRLNGAAGEATAAVDLHRTQMSLPWQSFDAESNATGTFGLDWQGLSGTVVLSEAQETLSFTNLGLGDGVSKITLDGATLFSADLNPDNGRRFDLTVSTVPGELPTFAFSPKMSLELFYDFSPLAAAGDEVPEYLLGETFGIHVEGDSPVLQPVEGLEAGGIRVVSGQLSVGSSASDIITVASGSCLVGDEFISGEHEIFGYFAAGACPE